MIIKKTQKLLLISMILMLASLVIICFTFGQVAASDNDNDGLDDDWETANGYDNKTTDKVKVYDDDQKVAVYNKDEFKRNEVSDNIINTFLFVLLMSFGIFSLLAGIFTAYFGAGKSRGIGAVLLILGLVVILIWVWYGVLNEYPDDSLLGIVHWDAAKTVEAFLTVLGAIFGAGLAIVLFLVAIMKS